MSYTVDTPQHQPNPYAGNSVPPQKSSNGFGIAALVVGIVAIILAFIPVIGIASFLLGLIAIVLGILGLRKKSAGKGTSITGLILGGLSLIIAGIVMAVTAAFVSAVDESLQSLPTSSAFSEELGSPEPIDPTDATEGAVPAAAEDDGPAAEEDTASDVPVEFQSALNQAQGYSDMMHLSKTGLWDQLTSEYGGQFTEEAADYAVENVEADWNENALEQGRSYQETMSMSPAAVYDQLVSEFGGKFSAEEAQYAVDNL